MMGFQSQYTFNYIIAAVNVSASIRHYSNKPFTHRSNAAFFFRGGNEALVSSSSHNSFIRFETVSFTRPRESATNHGSMQQNTAFVETIVLEVKGRDGIGSYLKSGLLCYDPELSEVQNCNLGEVIIQMNPENPQFPKRIKTYFQGTNKEAHMETQTLEINATGKYYYYLYFVFCDPALQGLS